jgi:phage terminase large subunit
MQLVDTIVEQRYTNVGIVYEVNRQMCECYRIIAHEGGTRSGKTYNTIEFLVDYALTNPGVEITIASRDMAHLKKGAIKDFLKIILERGLYRDDQWNISDKQYRFANNAYIEFFNADDLGKVSGPGRDVLFCNEVNFFKMNVFMQMLRRTRRFCIIDYNPIHPRHWVYDKVLKRADCFMWRSTFMDNLHFLPEEQIAEIKLMEEMDPLAWQVYGLGLRGQYQKGQVYGQKPNKPWTAITNAEFNAIAAREVLGLDWGFFPDPNALLGVKSVGNKRYIRGLNYRQKQSNEQLAEVLTALGYNEKTPIVADTSDNKSIVKLRTLGFPLVYQAIKPKVELSIKKIQPLEVYYVMDPDLEFEYTNYTYLLGPDEEPTGVAMDKHNHYMDAFRYVEEYKPYL